MHNAHCLFPSTAEDELVAPLLVLPPDSRPLFPDFGPSRTSRETVALVPDFGPSRTSSESLTPFPDFVPSRTSAVCTVRSLLLFPDVTTSCLISSSCCLLEVLYFGSSPAKGKASPLFCDDRSFSLAFDISLLLPTKFAFLSSQDAGHQSFLCHHG